MAIKQELLFCMFLLLFSFSVHSAQITVDNSWVEIHDNQAETETVEISVHGFGANEIVVVNVSVAGHVIENALGEPTTITTDTDGNGAIAFKPMQDSYTGRTKIIANSIDDNAVLEIIDGHSRQAINSEKQGLTFENVIKGSGTAAGRTIEFWVHYTQEAIDSVVPASDALTPEEVLRIMIDTYERQVDPLGWGYDMRITEMDSNDIAHLYLNDGYNVFHSNKSCWSRSGGNIAIGCRTDFRQYFTEANNKFSTLEAVLGHEHFHSIQYSFYTNELGGAKWIWVMTPHGLTKIKGHDWYLEGMARFTETITSTEDLFDENSLFANGGGGINKNGMKSYLNMPDRWLVKFSYDLAGLWGFLYGNDGGHSTLENILEAFRTAGTTDPVVDGPNAITNVLVSAGGRHASFEEAIVDFAKTVYKEELSWEGKNWSDILKPVKRIDTPTLFTGNRYRLTEDMGVGEYSGFRRDLLGNPIPENYTDDPANVNYWASDFWKLNIDHTILEIVVELEKDPNSEIVATLMVDNGSSFGEFELNESSGSLLASLPVNVSGAVEVVLIVTNAGHTGDQNYAFTIIEAKPNLKPVSIELSDNYPFEGDSVSVTANIENGGVTDASDVSVKLFDGISLVDESIIPIIEPYSSRDVSFNWVAGTGFSELNIVVDDVNSVDELDESDNVFSRGVWIVSELDDNGSSLSGGVKNNEVYETVMSLRMNENVIDANLVVTLLWSTSGVDLDLNLMAPDGTVYSGPDLSSEIITVHNPLEGVWRVMVSGEYVPENVSEYGYENFNLTARTETVTGGVRFSEISMDYVSTCSDFGDLAFVIEGEQDGELTISLEDAVSKLQKYFLTGLTVPDFKQWISLPPGGVDIEAPFEQTEVAKIMLEQDVELKRTGFPLSCETNVWPDSRAEWDRLLRESPFYDELMSAGFDREPQGWWRMEIVGSTVQADGDDCKIFITNAELGAETSALDLPMWIDLSGYNFRDEIVDDLDNRLALWRQWLHDTLNERVLPPMRHAVNTEERFAPIRELYPALALAQWYKEQSRENLPLAELIDAERLDGLEASVPFSEAYWVEQSLQELDFGPDCRGLGGVSLINLDADVEGTISADTQGLLNDAVYTSLMPEVDGKILFGEVLEPDLPDLISYNVMIGSRRLPETEETQIDYWVRNEGNVPADPFRVYLYIEYTRPDGNSLTFRVADDTIDGLDVEGVARGTIPFSTDLIGDHTLFFVVDYTGSVEEINERNNTRSLDFEVMKQIPTARISQPSTRESMRTVLTFGDVVRFVGQGFDDQDGELSGDSLVWSSSLQGEIGRGQDFNLNNLVSGVHVITLTVTDSDGFSDSAQTSVVVEQAVPEAEINSPRGFAIIEFGEVVEFSGTAEDREDGLLSGSSMQWTSSLDGVLGTGNSFSVGSLSRGTHTITLTVTDSDGLVGVDAIRVMVVDMEAFFLDSFDDGSSEQVLSFSDEFEGDEFLFLRLRKNISVLSASLDVTGLSNAGDSGLLFSFSESFDDDSLRSDITSADWSGGRVRASMAPVYLERVANQSFNNYGDPEWLDAECNGVGDVPDCGISRHGSNNVGQWGWYYSQLRAGSYAKMYQENIDLTDIDTLSFRYIFLSGYQPDVPLRDVLRLKIDGSTLFEYSYPSGSPTYRWNDLIEFDVSGYSGLHRVEFRFDVEGDSGWYWSPRFGSPSWYVAAVDEVRTSRQAYGDSIAASRVFYNSEDLITRAVLNASDDVSGGDIAYFLSADGGAHWEFVEKDEVHFFEFPGHDLRWKAELNPVADTQTPEIYSVSVDVFGEFPLNPYLDVGNNGFPDWFVEGEFFGTETTPDFSLTLEEFDQDVEQCPVGSEYCIVPLRFHSDNSARLRVNNINIQYVQIDASPPNIIDVFVSPEPSFSEDSLTLTAEVFDNRGVDRVTAELSGEEIVLSLVEEGEFFNTYSALLPSLNAGEYLIGVEAVDVGGLIEEDEFSLNVGSRRAELLVDSEEMYFLPRSVTERQDVNVIAVVENIGNLDAGDFEVQLLVDDVVVDSTVLSVASGSSESVEFSWNSVFGEHELKVKADVHDSITEDNVGNNEGVRTVNVVDASGPSAPSVLVSPSDWSRSTTHEFSWSALSDVSGIDRYEFRIDSGEWQSNGLSTSFTTLPQSSGLHVVSVRGVDGSGNLGEIGSGELLIDLSAPNTPVINELHSGSDWTVHDSPYFSWTNPGDFGSGITKYLVSVNGSVIDNDLNEFYHPTLETGVYDVKVKAVDALEQESAWSNELIIRIDKGLPGNVSVSSLTHPVEANWYQENVPIFEWVTPLDESGVSGYYYWVDGVEDTVPSVETVAFFTSETSVIIEEIPSGFGFGEMSEGLSDGVWYFHIRARDLAGNVGEATHFRVNVDNTPPLTTDNSDSEWHALDYRLELTAFDMLSGVNATYYTIDGSDPTTDSSVGTSIGFPGSGEFVVKYFSVDNVGNVEGISEALVKIDGGAPVINIIQPEPKAYSYTGDVNVSFEVTDDRNGLFSEAFIDGEPVFNGMFLSFNDYSLGDHVFTVNAEDMAGNRVTESVTFIVIDDVDPVSNHFLVGDHGLNDWFVSPVAVVFNAFDERSSVMEIRYLLSGVPGSVPGSDGNLFISNDGRHSLEYWAVDEYLNSESRHFLDDLLIDSVAPVTTAFSDGSSDCDRDVPVYLNAVDPWPPEVNRVSGVVGTKYQLYREGVPQGIMSLELHGNPVIPNEYEVHFGLEYWSRDFAGNEEEHNFLMFYRSGNFCTRI